MPRIPLEDHEIHLEYYRSEILFHFYSLSFPKENGFLKSFAQCGDYLYQIASSQSKLVRRGAPDHFLMSLLLELPFPRRFLNLVAIHLRKHTWSRKIPTQKNRLFRPT